MKSEKENPNVFLTLEHLLKFELMSSIINFGSGKKNLTAFYQVDMPQDLEVED